MKRLVKPSSKVASHLKVKLYDGESCGGTCENRTCGGGSGNNCTNKTCSK